MSDYFYLEFPSTESSANSLLDSARTLYDVNGTLDASIRYLLNSGLQGRFLDELDGRAQRIHRALSHVQLEIDEAGREILWIINKARDLDLECKQRFEVINASFPATQLSGLHSSDQPDWMNHLFSTEDGGWNGSHPSEAGAIVVNGIQNTHDNFRELMLETSKELGGVPVMGVYNRSYGQNTSGFVNDSVETMIDKFQANFGKRIGKENPAVRALVDAIMATDGTVPIIAHSQGGAITAVALWELHRTQSEEFMKKLTVITMGSAEFNFPAGPQYDHRVHLNDLVPMMVGGKIVHYHYDPLSLVTEYVEGNVKVYPDLNPTDAHSASSYFDNF